MSESFIRSGACGPAVRASRPSLGSPRPLPPRAASGEPGGVETLELALGLVALTGIATALWSLKAPAGPTAARQDLTAPAGAFGVAVAAQHDPDRVAGEPEALSNPLLQVAAVGEVEEAGVVDEHDHRGGVRTGLGGEVEA